MDELHQMLRSFRPEVKAAPDHRSVFREFLAHLGALQRQAVAKPRVKVTMRKKAVKRGKA